MFPSCFSYLSTDGLTIESPNYIHSFQCKIGRCTTDGAQFSSMYLFGLNATMDYPVDDFFCGRFVLKTIPAFYFLAACGPDGYLAS